MTYSVIGLLCVTLVGLLAHSVGICLVRAVRLTLNGKPSLLAAILMSGLWVGAFSVLANHYGWAQPFTRFAFHPAFAIGGFVFGVGASINQACSVSTLNQFARGNLSMLFTMAGWFIGWYIWGITSAKLAITINYQQLPLLNQPFVNTMFGLSVLFTLLIILFFPKERARWLSVSAIGLLVSVLFFIEPVWAPSRLVQDLGLSIVEDKQAPSIYRSALALMMLIGMWVSVMIYRDKRFRWPTINKSIRHSFAGVMMGVGGAIALGGNDSQILMGIPSMSFGAMTAIAFMLIGIAFEQSLYNRYNSLNLRPLFRSPLDNETEK